MNTTPTHGNGDVFGIKLRSILKRSSSIIFGKWEKQPEINSSLFSAIELSLLKIDASPALITSVISSLKKSISDSRKLSTDQIKTKLYHIILNIINPYIRPIPIAEKKPNIVIFCGINGSGKTTTIGKMVYLLNKNGHTVTVASCDITREAANLQLMQLIKDSDAHLVSQTVPNQTEVDIAVQAYKESIENSSDFLLIDTSGRLHTKIQSIENLKSISDAIRNFSEENSKVVLILDATHGYSVLTKQIAIFNNIVRVDGLVVTKMDNTLRSGVIPSLVNEFQLPIHAIGLGSGVEDLQDFDAHEFAAALCDIDIRAYK